MNTRLTALWVVPLVIAVDQITKHIVIGSPPKVLARGQLKDTIIILGSTEVFFITIVTDAPVLGCVCPANLCGSVS